ncbi:MAG: alpha/beta fold hydrolase [Clostridia bacterium]|nr:alpha/beta fold hydrolase [Clostridia bacterium]
MNTHQFTIMDDGIRLNAKLDYPKDFSGKCPLVIVIHGFTGHMEERHIIAVTEAINEAGFAALRVDMYGHGHSDGAFEDHTLYKWLTNALTVIDYARGLDFATDLYLCGHSQGGLTTILAGALKHDALKGLMPLSPATMIPEGARKGDLLGTSFDPDRIPEKLVAHDGRALKGNYARVAQTIHVEEAVDRFTGDVLLVHGDADEAVPVQCGIDTAKRYARCELVLIPGDNHCYDYHLEQVVEAVRRWLEARKA